LVISSAAVALLVRSPGLAAEVAAVEGQNEWAARRRGHKR
jgi:hypothetical protein